MIAAAAAADDNNKNNSTIDSLYHTRTHIHAQTRTHIRMCVCWGELLFTCVRICAFVCVCVCTFSEASYRIHLDVGLHCDLALRTCWIFRFQRQTFSTAVFRTDFGGLTRSQSLVVVLCVWVCVLVCVCRKYSMAGVLSSRCVDERPTDHPVKAAEHLPKGFSAHPVGGRRSVFDWNCEELNIRISTSTSHQCLPLCLWFVCDFVPGQVFFFSIQHKLI